MNVFSKIIVCLFFQLALLLTGCSSADDEMYLINNPERLSEVVKQCIVQRKDLNNFTDKCLMANKLWLELQSLRVEATLNSEDFGKKIMANQINLAKSLSAVREVQKSIRELQQSNGDDKLEILHKRLVERKHQHKLVEQRVNLLLTVIRIINQER